MASIEEVKRIVRGCANSPAPLTPMIWGVPGIGKTSLVKQVAEEMGVRFKSVIAHLYQPIDVLGLPYIVDGRCDYAPPTVFPDAERDGERGIFFIDELPNCVPAMQSAWGIIVLERGTKQYRFPPGWTIVCAGNRETDRAGASRLVSALENRVIHLTVETAHEEWMKHAMAQRMHSSVLAFLDNRKDALIKFDPKSPERAFPSPRAWERVSDLLKIDLPRTEQTEAIKGTVGVGMAVEFVSFLDTHRHVPSLEDALAGKVDLERIGEDTPDVMRALVYSTLAWMTEKSEEKTVAQRYNRALPLAEKLPEEWGTLLFRRAYEAQPPKVIMGTESWPRLSGKFLKYIR